MANDRKGAGRPAEDTVGVLWPGGRSVDESDGAERAEFGVLFVDGIAKQRPGSAVTSLAGALFRWLYRWNKAEGLWVPRSPVLRETRLPGPGDGQPAYVILEAPLFLSSGQRYGRWLLAESSWANAYATPRFLELAQWVWKVSTCLLVLQFVIPLRRHWRQYAQDRARGIALPRRLDSASACLAYLLLMGVAAMSSVLVSVVLLVLAMAAALPIPRIDKAVQWVVVHLSAILGDSYLLSHCPVEFAAMRSKVASDLRWLQERCDVVAVVAHSQGAAIAHQVLRDAGPAGGVQAFITAGQGISKLHLLQRMDWDPAGHRAAWHSRLFVVIGLLCAGLPALGVIAGRIGVPALQVLAAASWYPWQICAGFAFLVIGVRHALRANGSGVDESLALPRAAPHMTWRDYYASADPVSNGQLAPPGAIAAHGHPDPTSPQYGLPDPCDQVYNKGSLLTDHNGYLRNQDQFVSSLLNDLAAAAYGRADGPGACPRLVRQRDIDKASRHRKLLIRWLVVSRIVTLALGIVLGVLTAKVPVAGPANWLMHLGDPHVNIGDLAARLAVIAVLTLTAYTAIGVIPWRIMERRASRQFFDSATRYGHAAESPGTRVSDQQDGTDIAVRGNRQDPYPAHQISREAVSEQRG
jgi:hypothetical protein